MSTLKQLNFTRMHALRQLEQAPEEKWDTQPEGFSNTIRWNAGHIFVTMEVFVQKAIPEYTPVNPEWIPFFVTGSSTSQWEGEPPTNEELLTALKAQSERIVALLEGELDQTLAEPVRIGNIHTMETVDAVVQFIVWHEGMHAGLIQGLNRVVGK
ncbi:DinB family protein [Sporosarcina sp. ACRSM]|uniref:DinB family protein n=1 Tax=Sporosarcina sp. ACRSM TaxID=2918216 RepID=UPI001EF5546F|nr:DinB family protein [Sporosarcina sp. ACRSM]MCG7334889.1 DinB family protein [Sporosarcina sp. ACRSM]